MTSRILEVKDIEFFYGEVQALKGVNFCIEEGEIITLIGANGAGKSTSINLISGIFKPSKGEIFFRGSIISGLKPKRMIAMGISQVPEGRRVFPYMTVEENLRLGAYLKKDSGKIDENIEYIYKYFPRLKERKKQLAGSLSGGEQQMLAIGRALMSDPVLLMMDEPSLGLSPLLCIELAGIIRTINGNGASILLVEQNAMMALNLANHGYVMETGSIIEEGEAKNLLNNPMVKKAYLGG